MCNIQYIMCNIRTNLNIFEPLSVHGSSLLQIMKGQLVGLGSFGALWFGSLYHLQIACDDPNPKSGNHTNFNPNLSTKCSTKSP